VGGIAVRSSRGLVALLGLLGVCLASARAEAYCQTTTCNAKDPTAADACQYDAQGCATNGFKLYWPNACVSISTQADGSPLRGITSDTMNSMVGDAYYNWTNVDCGGQVPSIQVFTRSPVSCHQVQYNSRQPNANIWMFRDDKWPGDDVGTLALTTVTFNRTTGEIYDADVELNSAQNVITVGDTDVKFDLQSIVQHESGHTLGLSHSPLVYSTMDAMYSSGDVVKRTLSNDDVQGICAVYPPGQDRGACDPTPRHGFSSDCAAPTEKKRGCALEGPVRASLPGLAGLGLAILGAVGLRRRRRRARHI
jgi:hypothetical protein